MLGVNIWINDKVVSFRYLSFISSVKSIQRNCEFKKHIFTASLRNHGINKSNDKFINLKSYTKGLNQWYEMRR